MKLEASSTRRSNELASSREDESPTMTTDVPVKVMRGDLARSVLVVLLMLTLIAASLWILSPFLAAGLWALMIVVATWPLMLKVQTAVRRRAFAVALMSGSMLLVFVAPIILAIDALVENVDTMTMWLRSLADSEIPPPPDWLAAVPLVGAKFTARWLEVAGAGKEALAERVAPYATDAAHWLAAALGGIGILTVQMLLTIVMTVILFANGETARDALIGFGRRLAGERGESVVVLAGQAIRAVALGVVVTALVQTTLAGIGLAVAGVPFASLLTGVVLLLCIAQIGPILVLLPAAIWLFYTGSTGWGSAMLVWTVVVGLLDNVLRPMLIRRGADLPLLLIFAGVIGGLIAFGVVGLFIGPVVLAIGYTLMKEWVGERAAAP